MPEYKMTIKEKPFGILFPSLGDAVKCRNHLMEILHYAKGDIKISAVHDERNHGAGVESGID